MAQLRVALEQLALDPNPLRDVDRHAQQAPLAGDLDGLGREQDREQLAGLRANLDLEIPHASVGRDALDDVPPVLGVRPDADRGRGAAEDLLARVAQHVGEGPVDVDEAPVGHRGDRARVRHRVERDGESRLRRAQRLVGPSALGDVGEESVGDPEAVVNVRPVGAVVEPDPLAVLALDSVLDVEPLAVREEPVVGPLHAIQIVGVDPSEPEPLALFVDLLLAESVDLLDVRADEDRASGGVAAPRDVGDVGHERAVASVGEHPLRHVPILPDVGEEPSVEAGRDVVALEDAPVGEDDLLRGDRDARLEDLGDPNGEGRPVAHQVLCAIGRVRSVHAFDLGRHGAGEEQVAEGLVGDENCLVWRRDHDGGPDMVGERREDLQPDSHLPALVAHFRPD